jgi:arylsulfatase A-like enzyme
MRAVPRDPRDLTRRDFLKATGIGAATLAAGCAGPARLGSVKPTNVILIMADDLGWETLGCYGGTSYPTPFLDELARTGARFNHCYSQPLCTPTRVQLMTGQYNFRNYIGFGVLKPGEPTFGHMMQDAGYATCVVGKWQLWGSNDSRGMGGKGVYPDEAGFDEYCLWQVERIGSRYADPQMYVNRRQPERIQGAYGPDVATEYLLDFIARQDGGPFFAYYPMILPHDPFVPTPDSREWATGALTQADPRFFADMVTYMDKLVGQIIQGLEDLGLRENTLVVFLGDNGTNRNITSATTQGDFRGHKGFTDDGGTRVPLIANWPGTVPGGMVLDDLVDTTDFLPTVAAVTGARHPQGVVMDGRDFSSRLRGEAGDPREWVFCHYDPDWGNFTRARFVRDQRWKLYDDGRLFNVAADPLERRPRDPGSEGPAARAARRRLQEVLDEFG